MLQKQLNQSLKNLGATAVNQPSSRRDGKTRSSSSSSSSSSSDSSIDDRERDDRWVSQQSLADLEQQLVEKARLLHMLNNGHKAVFPLDAECVELRHVKAALEARIESLEKQTESFRYERDIWHEKFAAMSETQPLRHLRKGIELMLLVKQKRASKSRLDEMVDGTDNMELELLRLKLDTSIKAASVGLRSCE